MGWDGQDIQVLKPLIKEPNFFVLKLSSGFVISTFS
jgi:hypothetical protein